MILFIVYLLLGTITGFLSGFLGLGGGFVIVPALYAIFSTQSFPVETLMHTAIGSSLAIVAINSLSSTLVHHQKQSVVFHKLRLWIPAVSLGAISGAFLADQLDTHFLRQLFAVMILFAAWQLGFRHKKLQEKIKPSKVHQFLTTAAIGLLSAMIGIGGGSLLLPFSLSCKLTMKQAIGTAAACGIPIALFGTIGFAVMGYVHWPAVLGMALGGVMFVRLGAHVAHKVPDYWIRRVLVVLLFLISIRMFIE